MAPPCLLHCPFWNQQGLGVLTVKFNVCLIPPGSPGGGAGSQAVSRGRVFLDTVFQILTLKVDTRNPAKTSGVGSLGTGRSPPGAYMLFANFPISSFSFISPRVSVMTLKSLKLWAILRFDVGSFFFFFIGRRQKLEKRDHQEGANGKELGWPCRLEEKVPS